MQVKRVPLFEKKSSSVWERGNEKSAPVEPAPICMSQAEAN
jgi:hypothetical protein